MDERQGNGPIEEPSAWWREPQVLVLAVLVVGLYFTRLTALNLRGEETRRAQVAAEILWTGDWIVPRQQGQIYTSRPPAGSWPSAVLAGATGELDAVAVRLPTVCAILLTTLLIYGYGRTFLSRTGAFTAAVAYPSMGQVLQIGRLAETEGLFTLLVAGSLLIWHWGYTCGWPVWRTWSAGYALAALAGLTKGPQGLVYFAGVVGVFLLIRRDWRMLRGRGHFIGAAVFLAILAAWQIPYLNRTGWDLETTRRVWTGLASNRFMGYFSLVFARHLVRYPLEIVVCTLPWSLMLSAYALPRFRRTLSEMQPHLLFLVVCLAVTFPSVWFAPYARGRYYMPLYPVIAVLVGIVADRCLHATDNARLRAGWWRFNVGHVIGCGLGVAAVLVGWAAGMDWFDPLRQSTGLVLGTLAVVAVGMGLLWANRSWQTPRAAQVSVLAAAAVMGAWYAGLIVEVRRQIQPDVNAPMAELRERLPADVELVSYGRLHHAFLYHYGRLIPELPWPQSSASATGDGAAEVAVGDVFCVSKERLTKTPLPFPWEPIAEISCDGRDTDQAATTVIARRLPTLATRPETERRQ